MKLIVEIGIICWCILILVGFSIIGGKLYDFLTHATREIKISCTIKDCKYCIDGYCIRNEIHITKNRDGFVCCNDEELIENGE